MIRVGRLTDYAVTILCAIACEPSHKVSAQYISGVTGLSDTTVSKIMKTLNKAGMLQSMRGVKGGYVLARPVDTITLYNVISAMEGGVALTECSSDASALACVHESGCKTKFGWRKVNNAVKHALEEVFISDFIQEAQYHANTSFYVQHS